MRSPIRIPLDGRKLCHQRKLKTFLTLILFKSIDSIKTIKVNWEYKRKTTCKWKCAVNNQTTLESLLHQGFQARALQNYFPVACFLLISVCWFSPPTRTLDMQFHSINIDSLPKRTRMTVNSVSTCRRPESARISWKSRALNVKIIVLRFRNWFCGLALTFTDDSS